MSAVWEWLIGPESDCLRFVSAAIAIGVWVWATTPLPGGRLTPPTPPLPLSPQTTRRGRERGQSNGSSAGPPCDRRQPWTSITIPRRVPRA